MHFVVTSVENNLIKVFLFVVLIRFSDIKHDVNMNVYPDTL